MAARLVRGVALYLLAASSLSLLSISLDRVLKTAVLTESGAFLTKQFHFSPPTRFARRYRAELAAASAARVYLHANVIGIDANEAGSGVARVRVSTLSGKRIEVRSSHYVLATGGVENARLLLISDGVQQNGLGNDHDLVGRYFMDHPHKEDAGEVVLTRALADLSTYTRRGPLQAVLCPSETLQRTHGLLNCAVPEKKRAISTCGSQEELAWTLGESNRSVVAHHLARLGVRRFDRTELDRERPSLARTGKVQLKSGHLVRPH